MLSCRLYAGAWLVKWRLSVPSIRKVVGSTPPLATTEGPWASPSPVISCMTDVVPCGFLAANFDSCNSLISSVHTLFVNILGVSDCMLNENKKIKNM